MYLYVDWMCLLSGRIIDIQGIYKHQASSMTIVTDGNIVQPHYGSAMVIMH